MRKDSTVEVVGLGTDENTGAPTFTFSADDWMAADFMRRWAVAAEQYHGPSERVNDVRAAAKAFESYAVTKAAADAGPGNAPSQTPAVDPDKADEIAKLGEVTNAAAATAAANIAGRDTNTGRNRP